MLPVDPAEDQVNLAGCLVAKLIAGAPYTRETFHQCYFESLSPKSPESPQVSEKWIELLWSRLQAVPAAELVAAHRDRKRFSLLIYQAWGKAV